MQEAIVNAVIKFGFAMLVTCAAGVAQAAVPLTDQQMLNQYLAFTPAVDKKPANRLKPQEALVSALEQQQLERILFMDNPQGLLMSFVPMQSYSSLSLLLATHERKLMQIPSNPFGLTSSFGELALGNFGNEAFSYRWSGNLEDIISSADLLRVYQVNAYGEFEVNNVQGRVDFYVAFPDGKSEAIRFRQRNYQF